MICIILLMVIEHLARPFQNEFFILGQVVETYGVRFIEHRIGKPAQFFKFFVSLAMHAHIAPAFPLGI